MFQSKECRSCYDTIAELVLKKPDNCQHNYFNNQRTKCVVNERTRSLCSITIENLLPFCFPNPLCFQGQQRENYLDLLEKLG